MKDSQHGLDAVDVAESISKANNERFSTYDRRGKLDPKYIKGE